MTTEHTLSAVGVVMDCADPVTLADFWEAAIGFTVRTGDGNPYVTLSGSSLRRPLNHLTLQRVPEPKTTKNRTHIDLFAGDVAAEVERLVALGATVTARMPEDATGASLIFAELADPEGHEFCVVARPSRTG
jgi:predicted enzyme related to lactoylglutathione lyase